MPKRKPPVELSFEALLEFLSSYSLANTMQSPDLGLALKAFHKHVYSLMCWQAEFHRLRDLVGVEWFDECVSDCIQCLALLPQGFYKACKMLERSAIENYLRFALVSTGGSLEGIGTVQQLFTKVDEIAAGRGRELETRLQTLRERYALLSNYVHSSGVRLLTLSQALSMYPRADPQEVGNTVDGFLRTSRAMNFLLVNLHRQVFARMFFRNRDAILDALGPKEKELLAV